MNTFLKICAKIPDLSRPLALEKSKKIKKSIIDRKKSKIAGPDKKDASDRMYLWREERDGRDWRTSKEGTLESGSLLRLHSKVGGKIPRPLRLSRAQSEDGSDDFGKKR